MNDAETRATISVMWCASFASSASMRICDAMLPQLGLAFGGGTERTALTVSAFAIAYGVLQLFYGPIGDRFGKLRVIAWAAVASTLGCAACALSSTLDGLIAARIATGMTTAAIVPLGLAWIGDNVAYDQRQVTLARFITGSVAGLIAGQVLGGLVTDLWGWRTGFVLLALFYALAGTLLTRRVRRERVLAGAADSLARSPMGLPLRKALAALLGRRWVHVMLAIGFLEGALAFGALAFVPTFLHDRYAVPLSVAGAVLVSYGLGGLAYTRLAPRLVGALGEKGLAIGGGVLLGVAYAALPWAPGWIWTLPVMLVAGLGFYMLHATLQVNATQMSAQARGTATTLFVSALFIGQSVGVSAAAAAVDAHGFGFVSCYTALALPVLGLAFAAMLGLRGVRQRRAPKLS